jgi:hypothetical protein
LFMAALPGRTSTKNWRPRVPARRQSPVSVGVRSEAVQGRMGVRWRAGELERTGLTHRNGNGNGPGHRALARFSHVRQCEPVSSVEDRPLVDVAARSTRREPGVRIQLVIVVRSRTTPSTSIRGGAPRSMLEMPRMVMPRPPPSSGASPRRRRARVRVGPPGTHDVQPRGPCLCSVPPMLTSVPRSILVIAALMIGTL